MQIEKRIEKNRSLKMLSTMGVGGDASYYLLVKEIEEMKEALQYASSQKLPFFVLGKGSNCLFDDRGYRGLVIHNQIDFFEQNKEQIRVGSGLSFSSIGAKSVRSHLSGLEFASGIPGSVGGAIYMNASAHGQETATVLKEIFFITDDGKEQNFLASNVRFAYRYSSFQEMKGVIVSALFSLLPSEDAIEKERGFLSVRKKTQPLNKKSAGCIFRNPGREISAGALIEKSGLKGFAIGGARISEKHANFIVNEENASCKDVLELISHIQSRVLEKFGILLEKEVRFIPYGEFA